MFVITATFETDLAYAGVRELLEMGDSPERLAERLGISLDLDMVTEGVKTASFKRLVTEIRHAKNFQEWGRQIEDIRNGKTFSRFFGSAYQNKQIARLEEERKKLGSPLVAPAWLYRQPRVRLLAAIRDFALDSSLQNDAVWNDVETDKLAFPIAALFETADLPGAEALAVQLEKPLKDVDPKFLLQHCEGNRSIMFDMENKMVFYYAPAPTA